MRDWVAATPDELLVPWTVVQEAAYFAGDVSGARAEAALLRSVGRDAFTLEPLQLSDLSRAADLVEQYANFPLGFVDASIVAIAERLGVATLLTTDRRHFGVVRPAHCERLRLVP